MAEPAPPTITIVCPGCGVRSSNVPATWAGRAVRCPRCAISFRVAAASAAAPAPTVMEADPAAAATGPAAPAAASAGRPRPAPAPTQLEGAAAVTAPPTVGFVEWRVGDVVLDLYEVTGILGQGGMGRVYKVRHRGWEADLAVKAPLPSVLQALGGAENFEREAETWVNLGLHPHTVVCYYVRRVGGVPRVFAEFVDGGSVYEGIRNRRLATVDVILDVAIQLAWGLHYAHEQGLVHRDVKPANVMLTSDGVAKVTDFGLARARAAALPTTGGSGQTVVVAGGAGGTPAYMSPEQSAGRPLTRRTDLWSWALCVLEMFRGERTWEYGIAGAQVLKDHLAAGSGAGVAPVPPAVADLLARCFRDEPEERPRTLWDAALVLKQSYEEATGRPYGRAEPKSGRETAGSLSNRAVSLLDLGRDDVEPLWEKALKAEPHHVEATYNLAVHGWSRGRLTDEETLTRVEGARRTHPDSPRAAHLLGRLLLATGDYERASRTLEELRGPATPELERDRALALSARGAASASSDAELWRMALQRFARALEGGQDDPIDIVGHALGLLRSGQQDRARRFYEQATARRHDLPPRFEDAAARLLPGHHALRTIKGLTEPASALAASPDGRVLATASGGRDVRLWDGSAGTPLRTLQPAEGRMKAIAFSADGRLVAFGGEGAALQLWDTAGRLVRALPRHPGAVTAIALSADGRLAVSGATDRGVRVFDLATGQGQAVLEGHTEAVTAVAVSPDGGRALSGGLDGTVRVWDLRNRAAVAALEGHRGHVTAVAFGLQGRLAVSAGDDRTVRLWHLEGGQPPRVLAGHTLPVLCLAVLADGRTALSGGQDRGLRAWDLASGRLHSLVRFDAPVAAVAVGGGLAWTATGHSLVAVHPLDQPRLPSPAVARPVAASEVEQRQSSFLGRVSEARRSFEQGDLGRALDLAREARTIPGHERSEMAVALWDDICSFLPRKGLRSAWETAALEGHRDPVLAVALSPDGAMAVSGGMDSTLRSWAVSSRRPLSVWEGHEAAVTGAVFTPDGRHVVSGSWDHTARIWEAREGRSARVLRGHAEYVSCVSVSPDGARVLTGSWDHTLRLWDLATGRPLGTLEGHEANVGAAAFGPDGRFAVSGSWDGTVRAWDAQSRECVRVLTGHEGNVSAVCASPDGRQVASGGADAAVHVFDLKAGRAARVLTGHTAEVTAVLFTPDAGWILSASRDKTVRVWDLRTGRCERTLNHTAAVLALALSPSGNMLLTAGADCVLRVWHLDWEPEGRATAAWDEKARPFLESFISLRSKGGTAPAATWNEGDVDALLRDLRQRGFGGLERNTVVGKLQDLATRSTSTPTLWDEVRKSAPRAARRKAAQRRKLPSTRTMLIGAAAVLVVGWAVVFWPRGFKARLSPHMTQAVAREINVINLAAHGGGCGEGGFELYLERARAREVSADTLACLARMQQPGTVEAYLSGLSVPADEPDRAQRVRRNAVSLLVGLGAPAVSSICRALTAGGAEVRGFAATALAAMASKPATECLVDATSHPDASVRATATTMLRYLMSREQVAPERGWELIGRLLADPDPLVRSAAVECLGMFVWEQAKPAATRAASDPDPAVQATARRMLLHIENVRMMDLGR